MSEEAAVYAEAQAKIAPAVVTYGKSVGEDLTEAQAILERVSTQLARAVRRHRQIDLGQLDWLVGQVSLAAALVRAAGEQTS